MIPSIQAGQGGATGETPVFTDVTGPAGIAWKHFNGESPDRFLIETSCGGRPSWISTGTDCWTSTW